VATFFGISRQAVYLWFRGEVHPSKRHTEKLEKLIDKLSQN
jgi:predicted transcriptional regulator